MYKGSVKSNKGQKQKANNALCALWLATAHLDQHASLHMQNEQENGINVLSAMYEQ